MGSCGKPEPETDERGAPSVRGGKIEEETRCASVVGPDGILTRADYENSGVRHGFMDFF